jgi:NADPH2:quinone reductase
MLNNPKTMAFVDLQGFGGPETLVPAEGPLPSPGPGEVLIKVAAAGVNRPDVLQRKGGYAPPPGASLVPGLEVAGEVVGLGPDVQRWKVGDTLCALVAGGGYSAYCVTPGAQCLPIPEGFSMIEAAGLPETFMTVWTNVFQRGRLTAGESFLVHGGTSGIGTTAIMLAKAFGSRVFATAGTPEKARFCETLGAERGIDYRSEDFVGVVKEKTDGAGVDLILDMVGGDYTQRNFSALAVEGRLVQIAFLGGARTNLDLTPLMVKRLTFTGSTLRPRTIAQKAAIAAELEAKVWPLLSKGAIKPVIHATFPLSKAADAHRLMESSAHIGKIVLTI